MIIENISAIIEIVLVLLCLHMLNNKKIALNLSVISIVGLNILIMELINSYQLPAFFSFIVYFGIAIYIIVVFDSTMKEMLVDMSLLIINMSIIQSLAILIIINVVHVSVIDGFISAICNVIALFLMIFFHKVIGYSQIKRYVLSKNWVTNLLVTLCVTTMILGLVFIRISGIMPTLLFVWIVLFCGIMCVTWYRWMKQKEITKEREVDLQVQRLYYESFEKFLKELRENQHDYKNHLQALYNQQYINADKNVLQEKDAYYQQLAYSDRYSALLKCKNSIITGFLYGKLTEAEQSKVKIQYNVEIFSDEFGIPLYLIIEVLGILLDNAVEAVDDKEDKIVYFDLREDQNGLNIEVKNEIGKMTVSDFMLFFDGNKSTKGPDRGIGLMKIKQYCKKYGWKLMVDIQEENKKNYVTIEIALHK